MKFLRNLSVAAIAIGVIAGSAVAQVPGGQPTTDFKNMLDNGAMNIAQRGTTTVNTITTTATYLWDRWAGYSGTSTNLSLVNVSSSLPTGQNFTNAAQVQRASGQTGVVATCLVQEIPTADITPFAGQPITLSFWALAGSNFSAASSILNAKVTTGTAADEGLATLISGWTGAAQAIPTTNGNVTLTTGWQRFAVTGTLPATATEAAVQLCFTPVGTAGTNDYFQATGVQLERGTVGTSYEWRPLGIELTKAQRYYWQFLEAASSTATVGLCAAQSTTVAVCSIPTHVTMRAAPTVTCAIGTLKRQVAGTATAVSACAAAATTNGVSTPDSISITATVASGDTAGLAGILTGGNSTGAGKITASADF